MQLALLEALKLNLVKWLVFGQARDHVIEIAMLRLQFDEFAS